jgi:hypothetical protein
MPGSRRLEQPFGVLGRLYFIQGSEYAGSTVGFSAAKAKAQLDLNYKQHYIQAIQALASASTTLVLRTAQHIPWPPILPETLGKLFIATSADKEKQCKLWMEYP